MDFSTELQNAEIFPISLLKSDSTTDILRAILKIHGTLRGNYFSRVSFQYKYHWLIGEEPLPKTARNFSKISKHQFFGTSRNTCMK